LRLDWRFLLELLFGMSPIKRSITKITKKHKNLYFQLERDQMSNLNNGPQLSKRSVMMIVIDTFKYVKKLRESGMPEEKASVLISVINESWHEVLGNELLTKRDVEASIISLGVLINDLKTNVVQWIGITALAEISIIAVLLKLF
jgi:hypothetical protein